MSDVTDEKPKSISLQTVSAILGAIVGVITAIFGAGIYYEHLRQTLSEYVQKVDDNEKAIQSLQTQLTNARTSIAALTTFNTSLLRNEERLTPTAKDGLGCDKGQYLAGLRFFSESGLEHGAIYNIEMNCRRFSTD